MRGPHGPIPDHIPHSLSTEAPDFRYWALAIVVSLVIWSGLCLIGSWFVSLF